MKETLEYYPIQYGTIERERISLNNAYLPWKRAFDIVFASVVLLVFLPLLILIYLIVKLSSDESVFYKDLRYGKDSKKFYLYKFRTMTSKVDPDILEFYDKMNNNGLHVKTANDPRVTKFGKFLRKTSLDEIPNFLNVLKGEISVVGPRPLRLYAFDLSPSLKSVRNVVKPGITGVWQVNDRANCEKVEDMMEYDLEYIQNMSFELDMKLILKTIPTVLSTKGAM